LTAGIAVLSGKRADRSLVRPAGVTFPAEWPAVSFTVNVTSRAIFSAITTSKWSASCITGEFCSVAGTLSGVTRSLQNGSLNGGGAISTPLSGQNG
jgi:hypothetical protein